ncbi:MAG: GNAT family N-acetyltransferase [Burkholderiales bacterium]|nr:GNAT family N-acetyltransferase [Burkholderiales bacterium]
MTTFAVRILPWAVARPGARAVREAVFVREQGVPIELEWDELDASCEHALATDAGGAVIGTGRLLPDGRIGRMAVLAEWRGLGVGAAILAALVARALERDMRRVTLHAQTHAAGFYAKLGFTTIGETFMEAGIPHVAMARELAPAARS